MTISTITQPSSCVSSEDQQAPHSRRLPQADLTAESYRRQVAELLVMSDGDFGDLRPETLPAQWIVLQLDC